MKDTGQHGTVFVQLFMSVLLGILLPSLVHNFETSRETHFSFKFVEVQCSAALCSAVLTISPAVR